MVRMPRRGTLRRDARNGANSDQDIDIKREQFRDEPGDAIPVSVGVTLFKDEVATDLISPVHQTLTQSSIAHVGAVAGADEDITDARYRCLMRTYSEGPRGR